MNNQTKSKIISKINVIEQQLTSLDYYLPVTYDYLMVELDIQRRQLAEIEVLEAFQMIESEQSFRTSDPHSSNLDQQ